MLGRLGKISISLNLLLASALIQGLSRRISNQVQPANKTSSA